MEQPEPNGNTERPITLKDLIDAEARIEARIEGRITDAEARIEGRIADAEARIEDRVVAAIREDLESLETKLLTEFHGYTERTDLRLKRIEIAENTTAGRVTSLESEDRFTALELRVIETERRLRKVEEKLK